MSEKIYSFTHGTVQSWPQREQPVVVTFYAAFKHGPSDEQYVPYMSQNLNLTLDAARSLVATMSRAIAHAEQGPRVGTPADLGVEVL